MIGIQSEAQSLVGVDNTPVFNNFNCERTAWKTPLCELTASTLSVDYLAIAARCIPADWRSLVFVAEFVASASSVI